MLPDRFLRQILDNLTTAVLLLDSDLRLSFMNPAAEMLLAVSGQRVYQQPVQDLFTDSAAALDSLHNAVQNGHPFTKREAQLTLSNGQSMMADYSVTPIIAANRNWLLMELYPRDRLLRITKEEAQLSKQEVTKVLVRGLAHEIKNPLGGIRGAAQLLARELPEDGLKDYTDVIIEEADRLRNLVDSMLGPYRPPALRPINIHEITERVCSLIEAETQGALHIKRDYDPSIPDVQADREQLIQALLNIVRNAMQALAANGPLEQGQITLRTRTLRQFTIGQTRYRLVCRVEVIDNGPGIPADIAESIFYPMVSGRAEGTGLGLSITQNIISQHQGLIECDSVPGETTFTLFLPLEQEGAD
ncbi:MAG: nitrogen regulation protein NR(II) [Pseudomonadales bacterium]|uniref:nitrogen regulation protein NR(II) n=1 Tax=Halopseudomonas TaxID=2901189 RepID=UPI000C5FB35C|nr:nitrogen regulation protein NR(II) [Halopseudomonas aestusnigri]MAK73742.1 nitrogen regulation protein NR(II) [Pseudomonadales bacterium]MEE2799296.1 nitrogen regulation protein NR(II) [Pseudomonadota bacterium]HBT56576.1 nitrogen regulation protein NR(II) [Pseudomonas sp.]MAP75727.1 nitrogen regulation protein NR(II) [Pseudomonadales bacterium]MAS67251.1 nitrogen regulation protein NR(II) [Pseudomonadales bacterium]